MTENVCKKCGSPRSVGGWACPNCGQPQLPRWAVCLLWTGPILLFVAAAANGVLEVHSSTDTWIGLAAGRQILTSDEFPTTDTFSYTFNGEVWYNQNWLTHLYQYWLYSHIAPNAVIYGTWALSASVFFFTLLAAYWRSRSWLGALLAATVVALGCRDFLSARPATTGFFCIAALSALVYAIEGQGERRRWWPIALMLPLLLIWGNAHGSFVFGYGVLAIYVGHWFVCRTITVKHSWSFSLVAVLVVLLVGGIAYARVPAVDEATAAVQAARQNVLNIGESAFATPKLRLLFVALFAYAGYWICIRFKQPRLAIRDWQAYSIVGVVAVALILTIALGPFGIHNFTHGEKVASSDVFRQVSEWWPPYKDPMKHFPPTLRFWVILAGSVVVLAAAVITWLFINPRKKSQEDQRLHTSLFDLALVVIGLALTLWARRFAPIYFIFGIPVLLTWVMMLLRSLPPTVRGYGRLALMPGAAVGAIIVAIMTVQAARAELVTKFEHTPQFNLLERVTRYDITPHGAILYLRKNELNVDLMAEWTHGGPIMFNAPNAKIYMDGRAQQVYDETHYRKYCALLNSPDTPRPLLIKLLDEYDTEAVILRRTGRARNLWITLSQSRDWVLVLEDSRYRLYLRRNSNALEQVSDALRRGEEWRPNTALALATRGIVWEATAPRDLEQALGCWQAALEMDIRTASVTIRRICAAQVELGRKEDARRLVQRYYNRLNRPVPGMSDTLRQNTLKLFANCWADLESGTWDRK